MANWLTRQLQSFVYGPPARTYLPPIEKRDYGYAGRYELPNPIKLGTLISGPGATQLYRDAFGASDADNSAVAACLNAIARAYNEVPLRHWRHQGSNEDAAIVSPSPLDALLARPNPFMTLRQLRAYWVWCKQAHGNAYLWKSRAVNPDTGPVVELWPISPARIAPVRYKGSGDFISAYRYWPEESRKHMDIPVANIVHFKNGIDDENHMLGCSNLRRLAREIRTDRSATYAAERLLVNKGGASMVVEFDKEATITPEAATMMKAALVAEFTGENVGAIGVLAPGGKANQMGYSPRDMDLTALHRLPEERIAGVIGIPAIVAGLGAGLDRSTYSNVREAREMFTEQLLIPEWADDGETLTHQLLPDFTTAPGDYLAFDIRDARALQQDMDALYKRLTEAVLAGWLVDDEAREEVGRPALTPAQRAQLTAQAAVPALPPGGAQTRSLHLEHKTLGEREIEGLLLASREELVRQTQGAMETYLSGQRRRVVRRVEDAG